MPSPCLFALLHKCAVRKHKDMNRLVSRHGTVVSMEDGIFPMVRRANMHFEIHNTLIESGIKNQELQFLGMHLLSLGEATQDMSLAIAESICTGDAPDTSTGDGKTDPITALMGEVTNRYTDTMMLTLCLHACCDSNNWVGYN